MGHLFIEGVIDGFDLLCVSTIKDFTDDIYINAGQICLKGLVYDMKSTKNSTKVRHK